MFLFSVLKNIFSFCDWLGRGDCFGKEAVDVLDFFFFFLRTINFHILDIWGILRMRRNCMLSQKNILPTSPRLTCFLPAPDRLNEPLSPKGD